MTWVKICGITNLDDARAAVAAGADALGFVFAPSPRRVSPEQARAIIAALPPRVFKVGVFVNAPLPEIRETAEFCGLDLLQLHGEELPAYCQELNQRWGVVKAWRVGGPEDLAPLAVYHGTVQAFLLDSKVKGQYGGSGRSFPWELATAAKAWGRVILAGGLNAANIFSALAATHPYGVDVSSGVESAPGRKDPRKIQEFLRRVRAWEQGTRCAGGEADFGGVDSREPLIPADVRDAKPFCKYMSTAVARPGSKGGGEAQVEARTGARWCPAPRAILG